MRSDDILSNNLRRYYLYSFLSSFHFFSGVLIPFFFDFGHLNQFQVQVLQAWFSFWVFALEVPTGAVADYFGRRISLSVGAFLWILGVLIYGSYPSFYVFLLGEFVLAVGLALQSGADESLIYDSLRQSGRLDLAKKVFASARSFELAGIALSAPIGSLIASRFGLPAPMQFTAVSASLALVLALTLKEPQVRSTSESKRYLEIIRNGFGYLRNQPVLRMIALDSILVASASYFVLWTYQRLLGQVGVAIVWFGVFHLCLTVNQILVNQRSHWLEKWAGGSLKYLKWTALLVGLSFVLVALFPNLWTIVIFIILAGGFGLTRLTFVSAHLHRLIPSSQRATTVSTISMFRRFFLIFLNPVVGFSIDRSLGLTLLGLSLIPLGLFFFSPLKREMFAESA